MNIHGLQKLTLLDYPGKVACTVFLGGCNFRCPYCHNAELLDGTAPAVMDDSELLAFLKKRQGLLDGVCITGGEPILRPELPELLSRIRELGYQVKLDTNGSDPDRLSNILSCGLVDYVAMDIKNSPERYGLTVGIPDFDVRPIQESVRLLMEGKTEFEFRTTVLHFFHDDEAIRSIGQWIAGSPRYFLQSFVDRDTVPVAGLCPPAPQVMEHWLEIVRSFVPNAQIRGQ